MGRRADPVEVALVLGAGGSTGYAFHAGVLRALADVCGWDAREAGLIVGTSAGAQVGTLLRAGLSPRELFERVTRRTLPVTPRAHETGARRWPASPRYLRSVLRRPWRVRPALLASALLPEGKEDNQPLGELLTAMFARGWPERPLWITAIDLDRGTPVAFGRPGAPIVDVGTAVRCSSAIPGVRRPVRVGDARYVDGAIGSPTHLALLAPPAPAPRLILVLSPLSRFAPLKLLLRLERRRLARPGSTIVSLEPGPETAAAMGWNPMDPRKSPAVAETAYREAVRRLAAPTRSTSATTLATSR